MTFRVQQSMRQCVSYLSIIVLSTLSVTSGAAHADDANFSFDVITHKFSGTHAICARDGVTLKLKGVNTFRFHYAISGQIIDDHPKGDIPQALTPIIDVSTRSTGGAETGEATLNPGAKIANSKATDSLDSLLVPKFNTVVTKYAAFMKTANKSTQYLKSTRIYDQLRNAVLYGKTNKDIREKCEASIIAFQKALPGYKPEMAADAQTIGMDMIEPAQNAQADLENKYNEFKEAVVEWQVALAAYNASVNTVPNPVTGSTCLSDESVINNHKNVIVENGCSFTYKLSGVDPSPPAGGVPPKPVGGQTPPVGGAPPKPVGGQVSGVDGTQPAQTNSTPMTAATLSDTFINKLVDVVTALHDERSTMLTNISQRLGSAQKIFNDAEQAPDDIDWTFGPQRNADYLKITVTITNATGAGEAAVTPAKSGQQDPNTPAPAESNSDTPSPQVIDPAPVSITVPIYGREVIDFSLGIAITGLKSPNYFVKTTTTNGASVSVIANEPDPGADYFPTAFASYYKTRQGGLTYGATLGVATQNPISYMFGPSLVLGNRYRVLLSGGVALGTVSLLQGPVDSSSVTTKTVNRGSWFGSLSFRLSF